MSNHERGRKLMAAALEYLGEMDAAIARASWNITVRHAQDVVELVMKAVLGYLCIDYPKSTTPPTCSSPGLPGARWA
jgi:HEPN domain-containing protein